MPITDVLYKYLDVNGGLAMLKRHNLQFTNASKFNDPFDCHPALFDYSHASVNRNNWPPADFLSKKGENDMKRLRNSTWICCLSKVYDSLVMWAYYNCRWQRNKALSPIKCRLFRVCLFGCKHIASKKDRDYNGCKGLESKHQNISNDN